MKNAALLLLATLYMLPSFAQKGAAKDTLPYQKDPVLPAFNLLMEDSATIFNTYNIKKGKPTVLIYFSPDCDHCKKMIRALLDSMDQVSTAQFYIFTPMYLKELKDFAKQSNFKKYSNIVDGRDFQYFFPAYYGARYVPYIVVYDRQKRFVKLWEGGVRVAALKEVVDKL